MGRDLGLLLPNPEDLQTRKLLSQNWMICQFLIFRDYQEMNAFKKKSIGFVFGKVLDVGSGYIAFICKMKEN